MIQNNNTKDVAYLGCYKLKHQPHEAIIAKQLDTASANKCPTLIAYKFNATLFFDCSGTRYGFRIKELKSK